MAASLDPVKDYFRAVFPAAIGESLHPAPLCRPASLQSAPDCLRRIFSAGFPGSVSSSWLCWKHRTETAVLWRYITRSMMQRLDIRFLLHATHLQGSRINIITLRSPLAISFFQGVHRIIVNRPFRHRLHRPVRRSLLWRR